MSINICSEELFKSGLISIECPQCPADNHSVNNLFSNDIHLRRLGFRTEHFIRPPIEITFKSKFKFDLKQLEIGLKLNDNKTESFEIYSSNDSKNYQLITKQFNCRTNDSVYVRNVCFRPNSTLSSIQSLSDPSIDSSEVLLIKCYKNCFQINSIKIKILWTTNSSIPCIGFLKVFGQPIRQTDKQVLDKILELFSMNSSKNVSKRFSFYNSSEEQNNTLNETKFCENQMKRKLDSINDRNEDEIVIPEEFIDQITNEIMIVPILLPSGHSVDKTTLDKYLSEESKWCRPPSDPFTQLLFTSERQPKPNHILRQRIDEFLSQMCGQTSDEISNKRRVVGHNYGTNNANNLVSSKLLSTIPSNESSSGITSELCVECNENHSKSELIIIYRLICNHLICRTKLIEKFDNNLNQIKCKECQTQTTSHKIIKLNKI